MRGRGFHSGETQPTVRAGWTSISTREIHRSTIIGLRNPIRTMEEGHLLRELKTRESNTDGGVQTELKLKFLILIEAKTWEGER